MTSVGRSALALCTLAAIALSTIIVAAPAAPAQTATATDAFSELASCIAKSKHLLVVLLVDESGSLRQTDPENQRVLGSRVALAGLTALATNSDAAVDIQVARFAVDYTEVAGWRRLDDDSLSGVQRDIDDLAERNRGIDTDYVHALAGARSALAARSADVTKDGGKQPPCNAVLWFTDGQFDIEDRLSSRSKAFGVTKDYAPGVRLDQPGGGAQARDVGREHLCATNGLADGIRTDDIFAVAIALSTNIAPGDLDLLRAITNGTSNGVTCGSNGSALTGATLDAANVGDLLSVFDSAANKIAGGTSEGGDGATPMCQRDACPQGERSFQVDTTLRRFHLLVLADSPMVVELRGPGAPQSVRMEPGGSGVANIGDVALRYSWVSPTAITVDADMPKSRAGWTGTWTVTFIDPTGSHPTAAARSQIYLFGDLYPDVAGDRIFRVGEHNELRVDIVSDVTNKREPVGAASLAASVTDPASGSSEELSVSSAEPGTFTVAYDAPKELAASEVSVTLRLAVTTTSGIELAPAVRVVGVAVRPPVGFPTIKPGTLHLASIDNDEPTKATVTVTADENSGACVWLQGSTVDRAPPTAGELQVALEPAAMSQSSCLQLAAGASREISVVIDPEKSGRGPVDGVLRLAAASDENGETRESAVPFDFAMTRPINQAKRLATFLLLLLPGLLLPLLLAYAAAWWTARFEPVRLVTSALVPVSVLGTSIQRRDGSPLDLRPDDFTSPLTPTSGRTRRVDHLGYRFRTRTSWNPFAAPRGESRREGWLSTGRLGSARDDAARTGLALPGTWVLSVPHDAPTSRDEHGQPKVDGEALFVARDLSLDALDRLSSDARDNAPTAARGVVDDVEAARVARAAKQPAPPANDPDDPFADERPVFERSGTPPNPAASDDEPPWDR